MSEKRYKIVNTTIKPPRLDSNGKDLRSAIERRGHSIQFRDENDKAISVSPGRARIVTKIDGGLTGLQRAGMISIEQIDDVSSALKEHTLDNGEQHASKKTTKKKKTASKKKSSKKKTSTTSKQKASAVEMGQDSHGEQSGRQDEGYEGAKNPDGASNHRVVAPHKKKSTRSRRQRNTDEQELNLEGTSVQEESSSQESFEDQGSSQNDVSSESTL